MEGRDAATAPVGIWRLHNVGESGGWRRKIVPVIANSPVSP
jgi:hypothetical protein